MFSVLLLGMIQLPIHRLSDEQPTSREISSELQPTVHSADAQFSKSLSPDMVLVNGSAFTMGKIDGDAAAERDEHNRKIDFKGHTFYISKTEVSQELYSSVMNENPSKFKDPNNPVETVTWYDAIWFCNELSKKEGLDPVYTVKGTTVTWNGSANGYRLPTEAEWEYVAKANTKTVYAGSDTIEDVAWNKGNANSKTHPVGTKKPNGLGVFDMSGNVYEWVWDWHECTSTSFDKTKKCDGNYPEGVTLPTGWASGTEKVFRGGSYANPESSARVSNRGFYYAHYHSPKVGFRIVKNQSPYPEVTSTLKNKDTSKSSFKKLTDDNGKLTGVIINTLSKTVTIKNRGDCTDSMDTAEGCFYSTLDEVADLNDYIMTVKTNGENYPGEGGGGIYETSVSFIHKITGGYVYFPENFGTCTLWRYAVAPNTKNVVFYIEECGAVPKIMLFETETMEQIQVNALGTKSDIGACEVRWVDNKTYQVRCGADADTWKYQKTLSVPKR